MRGKTIKPGSFLKIPLNEGQFAYARVITKSILSFYQLLPLPADDQDAINQMKVTKPIFSIAVNKSAISQERWRIIGHASLEPRILENMPVFFRQSLYEPYDCWLVTTDPNYTRPLYPEECVNMEREAVWDNIEQVEERLRDHFDGRPNKWVERFRVKL
ncbi:MAG: Imm26 family immunity protein [Agriterribacter sp.]